VYDEPGRLVGVIDATGDAAIYHYDAVGNLPSISRSTATQVPVIAFAPEAGPVDQSVTIHGTSAPRRFPSIEDRRFRGFRVPNSLSDPLEISRTSRSGIQ
jgi:YD repeat-containing protein